MSMAPEDRREALKAAFTECRSCVRCPQLAQTRHSVVFGAGNADADLMFVGEAPGANEDRQGLPFVGRAGQLLDDLLGGIGLQRGDVFITNVLRCRPPGNRDPLPSEVDNCSQWLLDTIALVQPKLICTLGNFSTKLLRADPTGITRLHGRDEVKVVGDRAVRLMPLFHPATALYKEQMVEVLRRDFARIPAVLALPHPEQPGVVDALPAEVAEPDVPVLEVVEVAVPDEPAEVEPEPEPVAATVQLGLF